MDAPKRQPRRGDIVELEEKPTGYTSQHYNLTVGHNYEVLDTAGCCVITTTDTPGESGMYNSSRVKVVQTAQP